jgi:hypothetical protein
VPDLEVVSPGRQENSLTSALVSTCEIFTGPWTRPLRCRQPHSPCWICKHFRPRPLTSQSISLFVLRGRCMPRPAICIVVSPGVRCRDFVVSLFRVNEGLGGTVREGTRASSLGSPSLARRAQSQRDGRVAAENTRRPHEGPSAMPRPSLRDPLRWVPALLGLFSAAPPALSPSRIVFLRNSLRPFQGRWGGPVGSWRTLGGESVWAVLVPHPPSSGGAMSCRPLRGLGGGGFRGFRGLAVSGGALSGVRCPNGFVGSVVSAVVQRFRGLCPGSDAAGRAAPPRSSPEPRNPLSVNPGPKTPLKFGRFTHFEKSDWARRNREARLNRGTPEPLPHPHADRGHGPGLTVSRGKRRFADPVGFCGP